MNKDAVVSCEGKTVYVYGEEIGTAKLECEAQRIEKILREAFTRFAMELPK